MRLHISLLVSHFGDKHIDVKVCEARELDKNIGLRYWNFRDIKLH